VFEKSSKAEKMAFFFTLMTNSQKFVQHKGAKNESGEKMEGVCMYL